MKRLKVGQGPSYSCPVYSQKDCLCAGAVTRSHSVCLSAVFASPTMESWHRLYEVKESLGISSAMVKAADRACADIDYSAIEKNLADTGIGTWKEKRHRALMQLLLSTKSTDMFSVVRKTAMASRLDSMKKTSDTNRDSQFKKVKIQMSKLSVMGLPEGTDHSAQGWLVAARVTNPIRSTPPVKTAVQQMQKPGLIEWHDSLTLCLRTVEANSCLQLTVMPWGVASVRIDTFTDDCAHTLTLTLMDGTVPTTGVVDLRLHLSLSGLAAGAAVAAARKRHNTKRRGSLVSALGGLQRSNSRKGWGLLRKQNIAIAATQSLSMSAESRKLAAQELNDRSPLGQLMRHKLVSGEVSADSVTVMSTAATQDTPTSFQDKCKQIREQPLGGLNWLLVEGLPESPSLVGSGLGSLPEMCKHLDPSKVLFGLLRLGFGAGQFRRTKWCFFHWVGPSVGPVERGRANEATAQFLHLLQPTHVQYEAGSEEEASLPVFIAWITKIISGDDFTYSVDTFNAALDEEVAMHVAHKAQHPNDDCAASDDDEEYDSDDESVLFDVYGPERVRTLPSTPVGSNKLIVDLGYGSTKFGMCHEIAHGPTVLHNRAYLCTVAACGCLDEVRVNVVLLWHRLGDTS